MSDIKVTYQELFNAQSQLQNGNSQIQTTLSHLTSMVNNLGSSWAGAAQVQYDEYYQMWQQAAVKLNDALSHLATLTGQAAHHFQESDQAIANMFKPQ